MKLSTAFILQLFLLKCNTTWSWELHSYTIQIIQFEALEAEEKLLIDFSKVYVVGRERSLNGTVEILENMDDKNFQFSVDFQHDTYKIGQWQSVVYSVPMMNICQAMRSFTGKYGKSTFRQGENTDLPFDGNHCPLPKGTYYIKNVQMNADSWPNVLRVGGLQTNLRFYKHGKSVGGASWIVYIDEN